MHIDWDCRGILCLCLLIMLMGITPKHDNSFLKDLFTSYIPDQTAKVTKYCNNELYALNDQPSNHFLLTVSSIFNEVMFMFNLHNKPPRISYMVGIQATWFTSSPWYKTAAMMIKNNTIRHKKWFLLYYILYQLV